MIFPTIETLRDACRSLPPGDEVAAATATRARRR